MVGTFCISIDLELGWGIWDKPDVDYFERCVMREHAIVRALLDMLVTSELSATWAIVARLLELDEERARSTRYGPRLWYAPELVDAIRAAPVQQDIGSHSYAHPYFGQTSREAARQDLSSARRVHDQHGLAFTSFVFPRNQVAHVDLLRDAGVRVFRSVDEGWHVTVRNRVGRAAGRLAHLASNVIPLAPATVRPHHQANVVELPSSMLFMGRKGVRRALPSRAILSKARRGLDAAAERGGCFHLWLHPSNFYHHTQQQLSLFAAILDSATRLRRAGRIEFRAMSDYASA